MAQTPHSLLLEACHTTAIFAQLSVDCKRKGQSILHKLPRLYDLFGMAESDRRSRDGPRHR
jgi:hypothetical protein